MLLVKLTSPGPVLYWSGREGVGNKIFKMPKFRTMRIDTPAVATHLLSNLDQFLTPIGPSSGSFCQAPNDHPVYWHLTFR
ncbi:MAG: sugar transferase [Syntrophales bacterium]|nr:sugar transferase [Syntrophales bacterium]